MAAVLALKASGKYDQYVQTHVDSMMATPAWAHRGPAFLAWHREYLRRYELDLQAIDSSVTLPYWDWTIDNSATSSLWASDFMGGNGRPSDGIVIDGAFAYSTGAWTLNVNSGAGSDAGPELRRRFGVSASAPTLPTPADVTNALNTTPYDIAPYNGGFALGGFRNTLEGWRNGPALHNRVHVWVGGSMGPMSSPNDPVFFLHHCFVDKLWADWQMLHPTEGYLPVTGGPAGHNLGDSMQPWAGQGAVVTPASVLDHHALGYAYDTEGVCQPTLKFRDDFLPTLKFRDDGLPPTLKLRDDIPTLKLRDDIPTLKLRDDIPTLKLRDDVPTFKFVDDPGTIKFADDGTFKAIDDVKTQALDAAWLTPTAPELGMPSAMTPAAPFVLATPHHSMAWVRTFPGSLEATLAQLETQVAEHQAAIQELEGREAANQLTPAEAQQLSALRKDLNALMAEHDALSRGAR